MSDFTIRPMRPSDEPFVYKAWLRGYWEHFPARVIVSEAEFMERWHRVIERILADKRTITVVAHVEGEPDVLLGFACGRRYEDNVFHWAYVKQAFRGLGICREMTIKLMMGSRATHWNDYIGRPFDNYCPQLLKEYAE
jgi:hypothetical protein